MPVDPSAVHRNVTELLSRLGTAGVLPVRPPAQGLDALVSSAAEILEVDCVGVLLLDETDQMRAVAASAPLAAELEQAQAALGIGPGIDSVARSSTISVADLSQDAAYRPLADRLAEPGARAVVSAPVWVNDAVAGNLNAIRSESHEWSGAEIEAVEAYAALVATLLRFSAATISETGTRTAGEPAEDEPIGKPAPGSGS